LTPLLLITNPVQLNLGDIGQAFCIESGVFNPDWTDEKNHEVFGLCNNPNFHGHNYELIVQISGTIDPETGYVIDMKYVSDVVQSEVIKKFDHKNLNLDVPEFARLNPSAENIAVVIYQKLRKVFKPELDLKIRLYETERNFVEFPIN
jgi:6-pyruvoyltetrahydropterin/6-carboxytetrahydropterin synthase